MTNFFKIRKNEEKKKGEFFFDGSERRLHVHSHRGVQRGPCTSSEGTEQQNKTTNCQQRSNTHNRCLPSAITKNF